MIPVFTAFLLAAQYKRDSVESKVVVSLDDTYWDASIFMWKTDDRDKQCTRRGGPVQLTTKKRLMRIL